MTRITVHTAEHVTVTQRPHWIARWLLGYGESVRDAKRIRRPASWRRVGDQLVGTAFDVWIYGDNREVELEVQRAIERAMETA